jgi:diacylglycerol kinase family enzyme
MENEIAQHSATTHGGRWVLVQRNPISGSGRGRRALLDVCRELRRLGYRVRMFSSRAELDERLAAIDRSQLHGLIAAGGDGTVADLASRHPGVPLAILPLGTENLLAKFLGFTNCGRQLAAVVHRGQIGVLDTALAGATRFLLMLSAGVDAEVVQAMHQSRTGNIQRIQYLIPTLRSLLWHRPRRLRAIAEPVQADSASAAVACDASQAKQQTVEGSHIMVSNGPVYGFSLPFCPDAKMNDGLLDVRVFTGRSVREIWLHALKLTLRLNRGCR